MEKCHYCGITYHPMPRWMHKEKAMICVCNMVFKFADGELVGLTPGSPCEEKARADGYIKRLDLTPRR